MASTRTAPITRATSPTLTAMPALLATPSRSLKCSTRRESCLEISKSLVANRHHSYWDTRPFNNQAEWPTDGSQPFVWSFGDKTGYGIHGDYVFGWKGDALQRAMDQNCNSDLFANKINCNTLKTQSLADANKCVTSRKVNENLDGWLSTLPGDMPIG